MYKALIAVESPLSPTEFRSDLEAAGIDVVAETSGAETLAQDVVRYSPDFVVAVSTSPSRLLIEAAQLLSTLAPCPLILFTADASAEKIERASGVGVHAYVVDGYAKHRLLSIIQVARARFRHEQLVKEELVDLSQRFEERKLVDRAKGVLMRSRGVSEDESFELLRGLAMRSRQRLGVVAQSVIDMSRAGEAVNRSGQLRMLSQRIVKCYAQALTDCDREQALTLLADCVARVESNLGILRRAVSTKGYAELVEAVAARWNEVVQICAAVPNSSSLGFLDSTADAMLKEAERLTEFLESSGLVSNLHVLNVSGRQRMLSQRIAKVCFLLAHAPTPGHMEHLQGLITSFQSAMDFLSAVPLSSAPIQKQLQLSLTDWANMQGALSRREQASALAEMSVTSERLLEALERLTEEYEHAMQVLIGNRTPRFER